MRIFDITDYGAIGDGKRDNADAIQKAIDDCSQSGGGIVKIPGNNVFLTGPFNLKSYVNFQVGRDATLLANPDESAYTKSAFKDNFAEGSIWIGGENAEGVTISGEGILDGNGIAFMGPEERAAYVLKKFHTIDPRPHLFTPVNFKNLVIRNVTFRNSAYWCLHLVGCYDVAIFGIRIMNNLKIRNSDGIDIDHTRNVRIRDCYIESGDDCICFKTRREYKEYGPTENVTVSDCTMTSTSCSIKFGSENVDAIRNVDVRNCIIKSSNRGIGIQNRDEGTIENLTFSDISVEGRLFDDVWWGKAEPIYVTAYKRKASKGKDSNLRFAEGQTEGKVGEVKNVAFSNIDCRSENGIFVGGENKKINDIRFDGVSVEVEKKTDYAGGVYDLRPSESVGLLKNDTSGFYLLNAEAVSLRNCSVKWGEKKAPYFKHAIFASNTCDLGIDNFAGEGARDGIEPIKCVDCERVSIR